MHFKKGDILIASKRTRDSGYHPIIYLEKLNDNDFVGAMVTHSNRFKDNIRMNESHFKQPKDNASFAYDSTHVVKVKLLKPWGWGPFEKVTSLTPEGIMFVNNILNSTDPVDWEQYIQSNSHRKTLS